MRTNSAGLGLSVWLTWVHMVLSACSGGDVWLGGVNGPLDMDVCSGENTSCEPSVAGQALATREPQPCDSPLVTGLQLDFVIDARAEFCPTSICSAHMLQLHVAADGTLWVLGATGAYKGALATIWIRRYDADGALLSVHDLSGSVPFNRDELLPNADFALDERSHAFVVLQDGPYEISERTRTWFVELDDRARPTHTPIAFGALGDPQIALLEDGEVVITGNAPAKTRRGILVKLDSQGERVWSQTDVRTNRDPDPASLLSIGVVGLASSSAHSVVLAERDRQGDDAGFGLMRFDAEGNVVWDLVLDTPFVAGTYPELIGAAEGGVLVNGTVLHTSGGLNYLDQHWLGHVDAAGDSSWVYTFDAQNGLQAALRADTSDTYISVDAFGGEDYLAIVSEDGQHCTRYALPNSPDPRAAFSSQAPLIDVDPRGRVYAMSSAEGLLGRWRLDSE